MLFIYQRVDDGTLEKFSYAKSFKTHMGDLQKSFQGVEKAKKVRLQSLRAVRNIEDENKRDDSILFYKSTEGGK